jgi:hypothetical protein
LSPPTANARLLEICAAGTTADWDSPETKGPPKFKGSVGAVYTERRERVTGEGTGTSTAENFNMRRSLIVYPRELPADLVIDQRDTVVYVWRNRKLTGSVLSVEEYDVPGRNVPGSVRISIEPEG